MVILAVSLTRIVAEPCAAAQTKLPSPNLLASFFRKDSIVMTDTSLPVKALNAHDYSRGAALSAPHIATIHQRPYLAEAPHEDDGQISCICGYADDDGYTVACDSCNRWQHQLCYYPQYDDGGLPHDLQHYCIDCRYRPIDKEKARTRQREHREKREHAESLTNGVKRAVSKSHKKKVKEPGPQTNGWPVDKIRHDRNSASPRDVAPPAKRPKTSHRTSDSITTTTATITNTTTVPTAKGHSRKRNASTANHRRSVSRPPDSNVDQYSAEFLQCYEEDQWDITGANLHNSISVTNALSEWVDLPEDEFKVVHGQAKGDLLNRWDGNLEDIPGRASVAVELRQDDTVLYGGRHPTWKFLTVEDPVPSGAYIGELKGRIDFKKEYQEETKNRWSRLRHPEPFVFFHPSLPIVIDAREEGTALRYVRRSCRPNARLQILVTNHVDYHFCFMATQQIDPGMEIAMGWDTNDGLPELTNRNNILEGDMELLSDWVSTALANCGPCACQLPAEDCMMSRFDRRTRGNESDVQPPKTVKSKKRKAINQISPLNTNTVNSRSGSEVRKVEPDDEGTDSRSVSGSAGRGSASRDITPNTHYSTNGGQSTMPEISERERKKMAKEEEIFRRQEEERTGKRGKITKRSSAGSNLNTPSATSSKQLGFPPTGTSKYVDSGTSKQVGMPANKSGPGRKPKVQRPSTRPVGRPANRPKPVYVDANTQCDLDAEEASRNAALRTPKVSPKKRYISSRQRLLDRCARNNSHCRPTKTSSSTSSTPGAQLDIHEDKMDVEKSLASPSALSPTALAKSPPVVSLEHQHVPLSDHEMADAPPQDLPKVESPVEDRVLPSSPREPSDQADGSKQASPVDARMPSLPSVASTSDADSTEVPPLETTAMHIDMPPPLASTSSITAGSIAQSPAGLGSGTVFSPAVTAAVSPSPARKKLSLSDYTRRKAKPDGKPDRESSPASVASGPAVQNQSSSAEGVTDGDVKMEDADITSPQA